MPIRGTAVSGTSLHWLHFFNNFPFWATVATKEKKKEKEDVIHILSYVNDT